MKKIVSLLILVFALSSCSNSSNNASENLFLNINISGTSYTSEGLFQLVLVVQEIVQTMGICFCNM